MGRFKESEILEHGISLCKGITDNVFTQDRPKAEMRNKMDDFIIVSVDGYLNDHVIGNETGIVYGTMLFSIFARDKSYGMDDTRLTAMSDALIDRFPASSNGILIYKPTLLVSGSDDLGFSAYFVQAKLRVV